MKSSYIAPFKAGSICYIIVGAGHLLVDIIMNSRESEVFALEEQMKAYKLDLFQKLQLFGEHNMFILFNGFSLTMGILLLGFGIHNYLLADKIKNDGQDFGPIFISALLISAVTFIMTIKHFMIVPQALTLLALIFFSISYMRYRAAASVAAAV